MVGGAGARVAFERVGVVFIENDSTEAAKWQVVCLISKGARA